MHRRLAPIDNGDSPILLVGPGRSGSTVLHYLLAMHPDMAWISSWTGRFPVVPQLSVLSKLNEFPFLEQRNRTRRYWPRPTEAYMFWDHFIPGFSSAEIDLPPSALMAEQAASLRLAFWRHQRWQRKTHMIAKYTGWPRFGLMTAVFPSARLLHLERDPRAIVNSYFMKGWRWGDIHSADFDRLDRKQRLEYYAKRYLRYYSAKKRCDSGTYLQLFYEDLVADPQGFLWGLMDNVGLSMTPSYERFLATYPVHKETNRRYESDMTAYERDLINALLQDPLAEMDYA